MAQNPNLIRLGGIYDINTTHGFNKFYKRAKKRGKDMQKLAWVVNQLASNTLSPRCKEHALRGKYAGCMECHIEPDWLLIYKKDRGKLVLVLMDTGTHSDLFDE